MKCLATWTTFSLTLIAVAGSGSGDSAPNDSGTTASLDETLRIHIDGFKKSKSGAT